jgi:hypothetical protein
MQTDRAVVYGFMSNESAIEGYNGFAPCLLNGKSLAAAMILL